MRVVLIAVEIERAMLVVVEIERAMLVVVEIERAMLVAVEIERKVLIAVETEIVALVADEMDRSTRQENQRGWKAKAKSSNDRLWVRGKSWRGCDLNLG